MAPLEYTFQRRRVGALEERSSSVAGDAPFVTENTSISSSSTDWDSLRGILGFTPSFSLANLRSTEKSPEGDTTGTEGQKQAKEAKQSESLDQQGAQDGGEEENQQEEGNTSPEETCPKGGNGSEKGDEQPIETLTNLPLDPTPTLPDSSPSIPASTTSDFSTIAATSSSTTPAVTFVVSLPSQEPGPELPATTTSTDVLSTTTTVPAVTSTAALTTTYLDSSAATTLSVTSTLETNIPVGTTSEENTGQFTSATTTAASTAPNPSGSLTSSSLPLATILPIVTTAKPEPEFTALSVGTATQISPDAVKTQDNPDLSASPTPISDRPTAAGIATSPAPVTAISTASTSTATTPASIPTTTTPASVFTTDTLGTSSSLALGTEVSSTTAPTPTSTPGVAALDSGSSSRTKTLIGGAIGGSILILVFMLLAWCFLRRRRYAEERALISNFDSFTQVPPRNKEKSSARRSSFGNRMTTQPPAMKQNISNPFLTATSKARQHWPFSEMASFNRDQLSSSSRNTMRSNSVEPPDNDPFRDPRNPFEDVIPDSPPPQIPVHVLQPAMPKPHELRRDARRFGPASQTTSTYSTTSEKSAQYGYAM